MLQLTRVHGLQRERVLRLSLPIQTLQQVDVASGSIHTEQIADAPLAGMSCRGPAVLEEVAHQSVERQRVRVMGCHAYDGGGSAGRGVLIDQGQVGGVQERGEVVVHIRHEDGNLDKGRNGVKCYCPTHL